MEIQVLAKIPSGEPAQKLEMVGEARKHPAGARVRLNHVAVAIGVTLKGADRTVKIRVLFPDLQRCIHEPHLVIKQRQYRLFRDHDTVGHRKTASYAIKDSVSGGGDGEVFRVDLQYLRVPLVFRLRQRNIKRIAALIGHTISYVDSLDILLSYVANPELEIIW